jgi:hypothetical protein
MGAPQKTVLSAKRQNGRAGATKKAGLDNPCRFVSDRLMTNLLKFRTPLPEEACPCHSLKISHKKVGTTKSKKVAQASSLWGRRQLVGADKEQPRAAVLHLNCKDQEFLRNFRS